MKVLVLGASGFIGSAVTQAFARSGHITYGLIRRPELESQLVKDEIFPILGDVRHPQTWLPTARSVDLVVDCTSEYTEPTKLFDTIYENVVEISKARMEQGGGKLGFIFTSGLWIYSSIDRYSIKSESTLLNTDFELDMWRPPCEQRIINSHYLDGIVIRPGAAYGKGGSLTAAWFGDSMNADGNDRKLEGIGSEEVRWSFVHVDDLADAYVRAAERVDIVKGQIFIVVNNCSESIGDALKAVARVTGYKGVINFRAPENEFEKAMTLTGIFTNRKAQTLLGWQQKHVGFVDGIETGLDDSWLEKEPNTRTEDEIDSPEGDRIPLLTMGTTWRDVHVSIESIYRIDRSILFSSKLEMERHILESKDCNLDEVTQMILEKKSFPDQGSRRTAAASVLHQCLTKIRDSYNLVNEISAIAQTKFDSSKKTHEKKLLELWDLLMPDETLENRYSEQWVKIGFQGKDPSTDFRGMGILGLDDLIYYAKHYPESSRNALNCSRRADLWYPFATVGINITSFAIQTLRTRQMQYFLFMYGTTKEVYHEFFCYLFHSFNLYWISQEVPTNAMEFQGIFEKFGKMIIKDLLERKPMVLNESKEIFLQSKKEI
ncbi:17379_t:CDS:10 [Acaulospora morrowiae]|uniref:17379_t:CDS:1 n=1 Tax=Acaulospora morrowiae TaxID=94023 RepID=A0A9N8VYU1_9GLOM|nr:17379_t:CDS:10 [Acaulospora morrowiae]